MNLTYSTVDSFCQRIIPNAKQPFIDMRDINFIEPYALIYLSLYIEWYNERGTYFEIIGPRSTRVKDYLSAQQFWGRNRIDYKEQKSRFSLTNRTSFNDIIVLANESNTADDVSQNVLDVLSKNSVGRRADVGLVAEFASELVDNFVQHSEEELAICALQLYPQLGRLDFAIGDSGIGIRSSLTRNPTFAHLRSSSHESAAIKAFEGNVSRRSEGGRGLTDAREYVNELDGQIFLSTGDGWVLWNRKGLASGSQAYDLSGVQVEVSIPLGG